MAIDLAQPVGPLPLGLWIAGGGIGAGLLYLRTRNAKSTVAVDPASGLSPLNTVGNGSQSLFIQQAPPTPDPPVKIVTNQEWFLKVSADLVAHNYDAALVDQSLRKYLLGVDPGPRGWVIVKEGLLLDGPPPEPFGPAEGNGPPVNPPPPAPGPTPTPKPPPPTPKPKPPPPSKKPTRTQVVTPWPTQTSTLWGIAVKWYGDGNQWHKIYNANLNKIHDPNLIYPGQVFVIP